MNYIVFPCTEKLNKGKKSQTFFIVLCLCIMTCIETAIALQWKSLHRLKITSKNHGLRTQSVTSIHTSNSLKFDQYFLNVELFLLQNSFKELKNSFFLICFQFCQDSAVQI